MTRKLLSPGFILAFVGVAVVGYMAFVLPQYARSQSTGEYTPPEDIPRWVGKACVEATDEDRGLDQKALQVFRDFHNQNGGGLSRAAFAYFAQDKHRQDGKEIMRICPNDEASEGIAQLTAGTPFWRVGGFPGDHDVQHLRVARNVGPRRPEILSIVSETAFAERPVAGERLSLPQDIRALARVILAEYGTAAMPWSEQAFAAMGSRDELGTTAAQLAVATRHPGAMERTEQLLDGLLAQYPTDPIPDHAWMRFYELAYALAAAGPEAKPFAGPITRMTCRTVKVWAPPFGNLALPPDEMNRVLKIVGAEPCSAKPSKTDGRKVP